MASKIRLGMVGGGQGALIGAMHRLALNLDGAFDLVAGALSSTAEKSQSSGAELGLQPDRIYDDYIAMAKAEAQRPDGIQAVVIVTPNNSHFAISDTFLKRGIHVICDKPLTSTLEDAKALVQSVENADALFVLTHNYSGYPLIRQARDMIKNGDIGEVKVVQVEYPQEWMRTRGDSKQAEWRMDPTISGQGGATGDIGTHAHHLACFVTGLRVESVAADLHSFVSRHGLDDNAHVMLRFDGGARGMLWCSQISPGHENDLRLRVYGETGKLEWSQENPNQLWLSRLGSPKQLITRNGAGTGIPATRMSRTPAGLPEGYLEGFANIYLEAAAAIHAHQSKAPVSPDVSFPTVYDGLAGMHFVDACVRSSQQNAAWVKISLD